MAASGLTTSRRNAVTRSWGIRLSSTDLEGEALERAQIFAEWPQLDHDLSGCGGPHEVRALLQQSDPGAGPRRLGSHAGQLWRFAAELSRGDLVAMSVTGQRTLAIGRVVSDYLFRPSAAPAARHARKIVWLEEYVPVEALAGDLRNSVRSKARISQLMADPAGVRLAALAAGSPDPGPARAGAPRSARSRERVSVLDVGDGACSIIRSPGDDGDPVTVVDCGSTTMTADQVCDRLLDAVDGRPELINTIVVTHFDTDHYLGLIRLAERMHARGQRFRSLRLVSPRLPEVAPDAGILFLAFAMTVTGVRNLDLASELRRVTTGEFRYLPLARGRRGTFDAGSHRYEVLWPPPTLPPRLTRQVQKAVSGLEALAESLAAGGDTTLRTNIETARQGLWLNSRDADTVSNHFPDDSDWEIFEEDSGGEDILDLNPLNIPEHLQEQFKSVWAQMRRANNNMSLVFRDVERERLVVFGDAERPVMSWLVDHGIGPGRYQLMLAPHHGTHRLPPRFKVSADICVAQNGARRGHLWAHHRDTHGNDGVCLSTRSGTQHLFLM
jgi:hypothetical protein